MENVSEIFVSTFEKSNSEAYVYFALEDGNCLKAMAHSRGELTDMEEMDLRSYLKETRSCNEDNSRRNYTLYPGSK